jgi:adenosine kinase
MRIYVSGSLAYDRIMDFPGRFADHILPDKVHILNVCFLVNGMEEKLGGTAGNIAYSLALLGEAPTILGCAGKDFDRYEQSLKDKGLSTEGIRTVNEEFTAGAYITTDKDDNQITGFNPGAMRQPSEYCFPGLDPAGSLAVVSAGNVDDMLGYPAFYRDKGVPFIFDPGQQITALTGEQLLSGLTGAALLITNDYELQLIMESTGKSREELLGLVGGLVTTLGAEGSKVAAGDSETLVPAVAVGNAPDPTGAGDAFRAGLVKGLAQDLPLDEAAKVGATCASFCVEHHGTQEHTFTLEAFQARHTDTFGPPAWAGPLGAACHAATSV